MCHIAHKLMPILVLSKPLTTLKNNLSLAENTHQTVEHPSRLNIGENYDVFFTTHIKHAKNTLKSVFTLGVTLLTVHMSCADTASPTLITEPLPQRINFQHLLENKDIALGEVQAFLQDSQGFMWIGGGGGLIRYDGYEFKFVLKTIQTDTGTEKKPVKMVNHIYEDKDHVLWVSTRTGMLRYDPTKELLTPIPDSPNAPLTISTTTLWTSLDLPSGELLIGSANGLFILNKKNV